VSLFVLCGGDYVHIMYKKSENLKNI
jgi:hypothetical protein